MQKVREVAKVVATYERKWMDLVDPHDKLAAILEAAPEPNTKKIGCSYSNTARLTVFVFCSFSDTSAGPKFFVFGVFAAFGGVCKIVCVWNMLGGKHPSSGHQSGEKWGKTLVFPVFFSTHQTLFGVQTLFVVCSVCS
jgi:hypothetical protein